MKVKQSHAVSLLYYIIPINPLVRHCRRAQKRVHCSPKPRNHQPRSLSLRLPRPLAYDDFSSNNFDLSCIASAARCIHPPTDPLICCFLFNSAILVPGTWFFSRAVWLSLRCVYQIAQRLFLLQGKQYYCFQDTVIRYLLLIGPCSTCV